MEFYYYIVDEVGSSNKSELPTGTRVFKLPRELVYPPTNNPNSGPLWLDTGEGPYESIQQLKKDSRHYREVLRDNPKRAAKIFEERYLIEIGLSDFAAYSTHEGDEFHRYIYPLLLHTIVGEFSKNSVSGIHYFDPDRVKLLQILGFDKQTGILQAYIEVYNGNADKWIAKREPATFFPLAWSYSRIVAECKYAFVNRVKLSETKYKGITQSGVLVVFIQDKDGAFKTVYPVCEEL